MPVLLVLATYSLKAQSEKPLFYLNADSSRFILSCTGAAHLANLPLRCIQYHLLGFPN